MPPAKKAKPKASAKVARRAPAAAPARPTRVVDTSAVGDRVGVAEARPRSDARAANDTEVRMHETLVTADPRTPARTATSTRGKYVYCVVQATEPLKFGNIGLGAEPAEVHTVHYKDIAAVVSDTPIEVPDATRENVLAHERVNEIRRVLDGGARRKADRSSKA